VTQIVEREVLINGLRVIIQSDWISLFPRLAQGLTARDAEVDFSLSQASGPTIADLEPSLPVRSNGWVALLEATGIPRAARCRQVHGSTVVHVNSADLDLEGIRLVGEADGLVTDRVGVLLAATVADCVPVFFVDDERGTLGLAHAGWRGTAAGVVEATLERMEALGASRESVYVHLGPAICKTCYEIGPEVIRALGVGPPTSRFLDLRAEIAQRALAAGLDEARLSVSGACTRCETERYFSFRGGDQGQRMCAFLGWRAS